MNRDEFVDLVNSGASSGLLVKVYCLENGKSEEQVDLLFRILAELDVVTRSTIFTKLFKYAQNYYNTKFNIITLIDKDNTIIKIL